MPGSWAVCAAFGAAGSGFGGFWRAGRRAGEQEQATEIPADAAGGEPAGLAASFPGQAVVAGDGAGQAELGDRGDDQPGPAGDLLRMAQGGAVPAQGVLGEPVCSMSNR